jgi:hypothetical protein
MAVCQLLILMVARDGIGPSFVLQTKKIPDFSGLNFGEICSNAAET